MPKLDPPIEQQEDEQEDELLALESIFGDECLVDRQQRTVTVRVAVRGASLLLRAHLSEAYPDREAPLVELDGQVATDSITGFAIQAVQEIFVPGALYTAHGGRPRKRERHACRNSHVLGKKCFARDLQIARQSELFSLCLELALRRPASRPRTQLQRRKGGAHSQARPCCTPGSRPSESTWRTSCRSSRRQALRTASLLLDCNCRWAAGGCLGCGPLRRCGSSIFYNPGAAPGLLTHSLSHLLLSHELVLNNGRLEAALVKRAKLNKQISMPYRAGLPAPL